MESKDYLIRATAANGQIRAFAVTSKNMAEEARSIHNTSPVATAALGRMLSAASMMGSMMKGKNDILTLQIQCQGPIGGITVTADSKSNVKGYVVNPEVHLPASKQGKLDVGRSVGLGILNVIKDIGMKEPYVGQTHLVSGEIAEDLTYYYAISEQIPSTVALGVLMNKNNTVCQAGGYIIQLMPFVDESVVTRLEEICKEIKPVTSLLEEGKNPEAILQEILGEFELKIHDKLPTGFYCNCSKERVEKAIVSIGKKELETIIKDNQPIEVNCHFCNKNYTFNVNELEELKRKI